MTSAPSYFHIIFLLASIWNGSATRLGSETGSSDATTRELYFDKIDLSEVSLCGCNSCYDRGVSGWETRTGEESCAQRVMRLIADQQSPEEAACTQIAKIDFADECGPICDPDLCDGRADLATKLDRKPEKIFCGCEGCKTSTWVRMAGTFSCGARISYLTDFQGKTEAEACRKVAGEEFKDVCGACNPDTCEKADPQMFSEILDNAPDAEVESQPQQQGLEGRPQQPEFEDIPLSPEFPLYCFPPYEERERYENLWGKYTVEVKESDNLCGPSDNLFSSKTVSVNKDELTLQYRKIGDRWGASEVRVLLPQEEMPFQYGEYSFLVKSVEVIDSTSGAVIDTVLPVTLILGLFSWDATEDYSRHENYNHEVDVEISRWNIDDLPDVQYLVQPPGDPHKYRFFSGEEDTYRQAPHTYKFVWKPAEIDWSSTAGGGEHYFTYGTQDALNAGQPDYVQCMPADVEIRLNLWNLFGASSTPRGMLDTHMVQVVIDKFEFTPSGFTGLVEGSACSKDCQCDGSMVCLANKCWALSPTVGESFGGETPLPPGLVGDDTAAETISGAASEESSKDNGGMSRAGKALLTIFFLLLFAVIGIAIARQRRKKKHVARMATFSEQGKLSCVTTLNSSNPKRKVVVECWETTIEKTPSFEMALKKANMQ